MCVYKIYFSLFILIIFLSPFRSGTESDCPTSLVRQLLAEFWMWTQARFYILFLCQSMIFGRTQMHE